MHSSDMLLFQRASSGDDRGGSLQGYLIFLFIATTSAVGLRFVSRGLRSNATAWDRASSFWWDDWLVLCALPFLLLQFILTFVMINNGFGRHLGTLQPDEITLNLKLFFTGNFCFDTAIFLSRASALLFLVRLFPKAVNPTWYNMSLYIAQALNVAWWVGIVIATFFDCVPMEKNWFPTIEGDCSNSNRVYIGSAVASVVMDLIILLLPLPKIWNIKLGLARKSGLLVIFFLGYSVIVVSIGRTVTLLKSTKALNTDITYEAVPLFYWFETEPAICILCVCLPAMLPLGRKLVGSYFSPLWSKLSSVWTSRGSQSYSSSRRGNRKLYRGAAADSGSLPAEDFNETFPYANETVVGKQTAIANHGEDRTLSTQRLHHISNASGENAIELESQNHVQSGIQVNRTIDVNY